MLPPITVRPTTEDDWERVRTLRLENASDNPVSYGATAAYARRMTEEDWRLRARRGEGPTTTSLMALETTTGRPVGMMSAQQLDDDGPDPVLTGVYVSPAFRGRTAGVADTLLQGIVLWAVGRGETLRLYVDDQATPAQRFYARHGFAATGRERASRLLGDDPDATPRRLLELSRPL